jgi:hypothetical protein
MWRAGKTTWIRNARWRFEMKLNFSGIEVSKQFIRSAGAVLVCASLILPANAYLFAQPPDTSGTQEQAAAKIPPDQLDALVAPIALYPDSLLSQTLVASTYPLELIQLHQWLQKNKDLAKDQKKLAEKVAKQPWDPSIQAMAPLPDVVKWLAEDIQWTTDLGNAFLAQQNDVMDAIQRMRAKANQKGALVSNSQQKVETQVVESKQVIVIEQANPQVVYVPSYNPEYVYGPVGYPYPPIYYPPYYGTGAAIAAGAIGFGVGVAIGAAWGGGWGWGCGWGSGHNDINVNMNNNFNRVNNISGGNRVNTGNIGNRTSWQHNPTHRGGAPYGDRNTASRYGGASRGDSLANRQSNAQRQLGQQGGLSGNRGGAGVSTRDNAPRGGGVSNRDLGNRDAGNRANAGNRDIGNRDMGNRANAGNRDIGNRANAGNRDISNRDMGNRANAGSRDFGGSNKMGSRDFGSSSRSGGFGGGSSGWGGSSARSSSSRGMSSMGGGGMSRGGGGGMSRGGGGGRRR